MWWQGTLYEQAFRGRGHGPGACIFQDGQDIMPEIRTFPRGLRTVSSALRSSKTQRHELVSARDRPTEGPPPWRLYGGSANGARSFQRSMSISALNGAETDLELMERIRRGEDRALGELYDRHGGVMYSLARSIVSEPADAEEVVADAFLQVWRGASQYDRGRASVGAFLAVVTRSRALDMVRARRRRGAAEDQAAAWEEGGRAVALSASDPAPDRALELSETNAVVRRALDALPKAHREVILLAYFGGYSQTEIAARLSEPLGTVKTRVRTGLQKLREALSSHALEMES